VAALGGGGLGALEGAQAGGVGRGALAVAASTPSGAGAAEVRKLSLWRGWFY
jgi:hypothetical protein